MTASELAEYFSDRKFFTNPDQEVRFVLFSEDVPLEKGTRLDMRGSSVPETDVAVVALWPARKRKYMFSLKFEANPVIEADSLEEAEEKAHRMMEGLTVNSYVEGPDPSYVAQEPVFLEEVKE